MCRFSCNGASTFYRHDLCSLTGLRWLNDQVVMQEIQVLKPYQVIQVYLSLVVERSSWTTFKEQHMPKVKMHLVFLNSVSVQLSSRCWLCPRSSIRISCGSQGDMLQLLGMKSAGLNMIFDAFMWMYSWTSNMNLFENDLVLFPMHIDLSHWVLAVADFRSKSITSYDRWCPLTLYPWPCLSVWEILIKPLWRQYWPIWTPSTRPPKVQSWRDSGCVKLQIVPSRYLAFSACPMNHL